MSDINTSNQLLSNISDDGLYSNLIKQLNKDFGLSGISYQFKLNSNPKELGGQLQRVVYDLITHNFSDYLNLLYRVDISENEIKKLDGSNIEKLSENVSRIILQRECKKVWIRNKL